LPDPDSLSYSDPACNTQLTRSEKLIGYTITEGTPSVGIDRCLSVAARAIAIKMADERKDLSSDEIKGLLLSYGIADGQIGLRTYSAVRAKTIAELIKRNVLAEVKRGGYTHFGVGALRKWFPPRICVVLVLVRRSVFLQPFPKRLDSPTEPLLSGRVISDYPKMTVFLRYPGGRVLMAGVELEESGEFNVPLPFDPKDPGTYLVEIEPEGERGPEVATLFTVDFMGSGQLPSVEIAAVKPKAPPSNIEEAKRLLLLWVNQERRARKLGLLAEDERLTALAQKRAVRMLEEGLPRHLDAKGRDAAHEAELAGIEFASLGENLAFDQDLFEAHRGLMESPSHRENILEPAYTHIGIGVAVREKKGSKLIAVAEVFVER